MARDQHSINKQELQAEEIHELTQEVLQTHLDLDMAQRQYEAADIWDVLIAAAVERTTVEMASELLRDAPSANSVRTPVYAMLEKVAGMRELEEQVNQMLVAHLPRSLRKSRLPAAIDLTEIPYHGEYEADEWVRRGKPKQGTSHFHVYATLYVVKKNKRYTVALTLVHRDERIVEVLKRLLNRGQQVGLRLKRLYLDRGFDNNGVVAYLKQQPFPTILPVTHRGRSGGTRKLLVGRKSYTTTYTRSSRIYGEQTFPVYIVCKYSRGRYGKHGLLRFAYVVIGQLAMAPHQVFQEYRRRFGIEASYRLMNTLRARTTTTNSRYRLLLVTLAFLLLNLWVYVKWHYLYRPQPGPRQVLHHLLPLARWRLWLWEVVKRRLGFSLSIPLPAFT